MDETNKQLIGEVREPLPVAPGPPERIEHEYVRNGVAQIFLEVEPLTGRSHVEAAERRTRQDWARWIEGMLEKRYPEAERVVLVMDPNTPGSNRCTRLTSPDTPANWRNDSKFITRRRR